MTSPLSAEDEAPHHPEPTTAWTETWEWRLVDPTRALGVVVVVIRRPAEHRMSYLGAVFGSGRPTVAVVEHDIVAPRTGLELRSSGIWADHTCETPFAHWSVGLEAFGLAFDEPEDAVTTERGHVTPVGADLEWEDELDVAALVGHPAADAGYHAAGTAHGEVLIGTESIELEGPGERHHRWGTGPRLAHWTTRPSSIRGPWPAERDAARALADDGTGRVVEWRLAAEPAESGSHLLLVSRPVD